MPMKLSAVLPSLSLALLLLAAGPRAHADIYGYVDEQGTAHFAAEKVDERYQLFFRNGQSFDTADGLGRVLPPARLGRGLPGTTTATPSEVSSTMRSATGRGLIASPTSDSSRALSLTCSATGLRVNSWIFSTTTLASIGMWVFEFISERNSSMTAF